jgi:hypothetical protein
MVFKENFKILEDTAKTYDIKGEVVEDKRLVVTHDAYAIGLMIEEVINKLENLRISSLLKR